MVESAIKNGGKRGGNLNSMAINTIRLSSTIRARQISPEAQQEVRMRAVTDLWKKIRELNDSDADRMKIADTYLKLGDVLQLLPQHYRIVLGGSIAPEG